METFSTSTFILSLLAAGSPVLLINGWISAKLTHADKFWNQLQSWGVAMIVTAGASLVHFIPISITDYWAWITAGLGNGLLANILYKSGAFNNILEKLGAKIAKA